MDYFYIAHSKSLPRDFDIDFQEDLLHFCASQTKGRRGGEWWDETSDIGANKD